MLYAAYRKSHCGHVHVIGGRWNQLRRQACIMHCVHRTERLSYTVTLSRASRAGIRVRWHKHVFLLQQLRQAAVLVHGHHDIRAANEFLVHVKLRDGRPVRVLLDSCRRSVFMFARAPHSTCARVALCYAVPDLSSSSSSTLKAVNFCGFTPCSPSI